MANDVKINISAVDQASKTLNDVNKSMQNMAGASNKLQKSQESMATSVFKGVASFEALKQVSYGLFT